MNIVIVGSGTVGSAICKQLISDGHNITVVDTNADSLAELANVCDVSCLEGNGAEVAVLRRAGAQDASLLIAVTPEDELNILCCAAAKKLGTEHTIARVRNPEYSELIHLMKSELNLSMTINPELAAAKDALAKGKNVAIVLLGAPYNAQLIPEGCAVVCSYSLTLESVAAAIDALCGKVEASGKLPVKI